MQVCSGNISVTNQKMVEVRHYIEPGGRSPFAEWVEELDDAASARITTALYRLEQGNFSNVKGVGGGVFEYRLDFGPDTGFTSTNREKHS